MKRAGELPRLYMMNEYTFPWVLSGTQRAREVEAALQRGELLPPARRRRLAYAAQVTTEARCGRGRNASYDKFFCEKSCALL